MFVVPIINSKCAEWTGVFLEKARGLKKNDAELNDGLYGPLF